MKNENMIRISKTTQNFINKLAINREFMEAERIVTAETKFAKRYWVCYNTVCKYMWYCKEKKLPRWQWVKVLDPIVVNKMRLTMSDTDIVAELKTSQWNLNIQCWTRYENWIGKVSRKRLVFRKEQEETFKEWLKTDRWETPEPTSYELEWQKQAIYIWTNPIKTLYTKIK